jgi:hypothetical protein
MLNGGAVAGRPGCQQETCVPMRAYGARFSFGERSPTSRRGCRCHPGDIPVAGASGGGYRAIQMVRQAGHLGNVG